MVFLPLIRNFRKMQKLSWALEKPCIGGSGRLSEMMQMEKPINAVNFFRIEDLCHLQHLCTCLFWSAKTAHTDSVFCLRTARTSYTSIEESFQKYFWVLATTNYRGGHRKACWRVSPILTDSLSKESNTRKCKWKICILHRNNKSQTKMFYAAIAKRLRLQNTINLKDNNVIILSVNTEIHVYRNSTSRPIIHIISINLLHNATYLSCYLQR